MSIFRRRRSRAETPALPVLQTGRLVLRSFDPNDAVDVYAYAQSENVGPMAGWAPHRSVEDSRAVVGMFIAGGEVWAVVEKKSGRVIGSIGLHADKKRSVDGARELGYALGERYWGLGYATEAAGAVLRYAFEELKCPVVSAAHFPFNTKSRHVIKKLGFTFEGTLRGAWRMPDGKIADELCYSMLRAEYEARTAGAAK